MPNNQLEKAVFVIYRTDQQSKSLNSQRAIRNEKFHKNE